MSRFEDDREVFAIGDLHGNHAGLRNILLRCSIIDRKDRWIARDIHLVQLGDILGRGGEPGKIFTLLKRLEQEAVDFGSQVHMLLGNHEAMSISGMLVYNTMEEFQDLADESLLETVGEEDGINERPGVRAAAGRESNGEKGGYGRRLDMLGARGFREA